MVPSRSNRYGTASRRSPSTPGVQPEIERVEHRLVDCLVLEIEVGLVGEEAVPVVGIGDRVPGPIRRLRVLEDDAGVLVQLWIVGPHVEVALGLPAGDLRARWNQGCWSDV